MAPLYTTAHPSAPAQASEDALEEDAKHFDDYLKENDQKLQEAVKRAEAEAKARQVGHSLHSGSQLPCAHPGGCWQRGFGAAC